MDFIHQVEPYITDKEINAVSEYMKGGGWLTEFKKTAEFENNISKFLDVRFSSVMTSGTVGLYLALLAAGVGKGDKVIVPNYTMIATINAVKWAQAEPVIVDVTRETLCMDMENIPLDSSCKALIYVSMNGRSGNMDDVALFCKKNDLVLIEDACQSLGSKNSGRYLGTFGDMGVFSFTPHKIITTGQGGAIVTNSDKLHGKIRKLKDFHRTEPATDWHDGIGFNFKFTDLQSVIGIEQLNTIDFRMDRKKEIYRKYIDGLSGIREVELLKIDLDETVPWFVDVLLPSREVRDALAVSLREKGIGSRSFYPPINHQSIYSSYKKGTFPVSESIAHRGLWLPSSVGLDNEKIDRVCKNIKDYFRR